MILIRADANEKIGTGHVMRCLSIAHALQRRGSEVTFITADHQADSLLQNSGISQVYMNTEWTDMEMELPALLSIIKTVQPALLLVDSYYVTESYFQELSKNITVGYIDDMNQKPWDVDVLVNYNIFASVYDYSWYEGSRTELLLGPRYAPLRSEFRGLPPHKIKEVTDIMVSAGGADPEKVTEKMIRYMSPVFPSIKFHFIVGALNPRIEGIKELAKEYRNVVLHINERHMSDLMQSCDIAISAAGSTLYELCATGIPTITYTLADNQLNAAAQFSAQKIMLNAGDGLYNSRFLEQMGKYLQMLIDNREIRNWYSRRMQTVVDGQGTERLCDKLFR